LSSYHLDHLQYLETEAIHIMREVAAEFERPALLFSGGKIPSVSCASRKRRSARRTSRAASSTSKTGHEFPELIEFRDRRAKELGAKLIVRTVEDAIAKGWPNRARRNQPQQTGRSPPCWRRLRSFQFDCAIGGARAMRKKARSKERFFSFRDSFGQWDPKGQRPEIWNLYNPRVNPGENMARLPALQLDGDGRVGIHQARKLEVPAIYFSHTRKCVRRNNSGCPSVIFCHPGKKSW